MQEINKLFIRLNYTKAESLRHADADNKYLVIETIYPLLKNLFCLCHNIMRLAV